MGRKTEKPREQLCIFFKGLHERSAAAASRRATPKSGRDGGQGEQSSEREADGADDLFTSSFLWLCMKSGYKERFFMSSITLFYFTFSFSLHFLHIFPFKSDPPQSSICFNIIVKFVNYMYIFFKTQGNHKLENLLLNNHLLIYSQSIPSGLLLTIMPFLAKESKNL